MPPHTALPRWRGFHLLDMFGPEHDGNWQENDFRWMRELGFDFVGLPVCFTLWVEDKDPYRLYEPGLKKLDRAVGLARKYGLHACVNLHTAPGYDVNDLVTFSYNLWKDQEALDAFCFQWIMLAERYRQVPSSELSFHLVNEPKEVGEKMSLEDHERVMRAAAAAIRKVRPDRPIFCDGPTWAFYACPNLADLDIAQCCRGYWPHAISHWGAEWDSAEQGPEPVWPGAVENGKTWNRQALEEHYRPFFELQDKGVGVICFEMGCYNKTPHHVALAWLRDVLDILTAHNIGYVFWNFRGSFGILDSKRADVDYEDFHGHKLDRKMLSLLQEF